MDNHNTLSNLKVLFVDDEDGIRESFQTLLELWCKEVYTAKDGEDGYKKFEQYNLDVIITDIRMPRSSGLEMIKKIKIKSPELPIIITTAFENNEYLHEAIKLKVDGYLVKPIEKKLLKESLLKVSKNNQLEKELEHKNKMNSIYLDISHSLMVSLDFNGKVLMINKKGCELLEYNEDEIIGKNWFDIGVLPLEILEDVKSYFNDLVSEKKELGDSYHENDLITKTGKKLTLLWINTILKDENNKPYGIFSSAMDITQMKKLEQEHLKQQEIILNQSRVAAVGEMLANIAHQWRQPLSIITTQVSALQVDLELKRDISDEKIEKCSSSVLSQAEYLSQTIEDFRDFFTSDLSLIKEFNIKKSIEKLKALIHDSFKNNYIECIVDLKECLITANENQLIQAIINICNNAKDALKDNEIASEDRFLIINLHQKGGFAILSLQDTGGGIDESIMDKIFDPYFTTKHSSIGTGIGLYMTHQIITKHLKGSIKAENVFYENNGKQLKGAKFEISLPLIQNYH